MTNSQANALADKWDGAYRADFNGRAVSIELIKALDDLGFNEQDAMEVYYSKALRWFFDANCDKVPVKSARRKFAAYVTELGDWVTDMFTKELGRELILRK